MIDSLERQLDLADNVEDRIRLLNAYTRAVAILAVPTLLVLAVLAAAFAYAVTKLPPFILSMAIVGGTLAGSGASLLRFFLTRDKDPQRPHPVDQASE